jgi:DNA repair exonuclease SbcCD ATPase subunit
MMRDHRRRTAHPLLVALVLVTSVASVEAQTSRGTDESTLQALLQEVRLLRQTLQRANLSAHRSQRIVERIRARGERAARLSRQLEEVRDEIGGIEVHLNQTGEREASLDAQIQQATDADQRKPLEAEKKELRYAQDEQRQRLERLKERESATLSEVQKEERTLGELEARLEALDREIEAEARRPGDKAAAAAPAAVPTTTSARTR